MKACDFQYAIKILRQAVDYTEATRDPAGFVAIRKWINEVEQAYKSEVGRHEISNNQTKKNH